MSKEVKAALVGGVFTVAAAIIGGLFLLRSVFVPPPPTVTPTFVPAAVTTQPNPTPTPLPTLMALPATIDTNDSHVCQNMVSFVGALHIAVTTYTCYEMLINSGQGSLSWKASGGPAGTKFDPPSYTLGPEQTQTVTITVTVSGGNPFSGTGVCPTPSYAYLTFMNETNPTDVVRVQWSCL